MFTREELLAWREELRCEREARGAAQAALVSAREALDAEVRARDDFFATAAHELRTPLAALVLHMQSLLRGDASADVDRLRARVKAMTKHASHMAALIDRLLDASQISAGNMRLFVEDVDLSDVVRDVATRFADDLERAGCSLDVHAEGPVVGRWDRLRLDQIVTNLVANAVKYGQGKAIDVVVEGDAWTGGSSYATEGSASPRPTRRGSSTSSSASP